MASCSISASPLRDVCKCFWPATQPLCPHPTEYLPAPKEASSVLFLSSISHLPLKHLPHPSLASSPLCSAPHQQGAGAYSNCPGRQHTQALNLGLAAGSAAGSFLLYSSTEPSCQQTGTQRCSPWPCLPCSPWPHCSCTPDTVPQLPSPCHIHHLAFR